jgi:diguanylate cyclase (GGDEF)-like protein/PAS domain S-box-containing protein
VPENLHANVVDALLGDSEPWVVCRPVRDEGEVVDFEYLLANEAATSWVGGGPLVGRRMLEVVPEVRASLFGEFARVLHSGGSLRRRVTTVPAADHPHRRGWVSLEIYGSWDVLVVHWRDAAREQQHEARLQALVEHANEIVSVARPDGILTYVSPAAERILGRLPTGEPFDRDVHPDDAPRARDAFQRLLADEDGAVVEFELRLGRVDGHWAWVQARATNHVRDPAVGGVVLNWRDITTQREMQDELRHQALHDPLTGLPNRRLLADHLDLALARTARHAGLIALMFCDVDHFKDVNDTLGHPAGDELLRAITSRLRRVVRPQDTVARMGGDEFVVLSEDLHAHAEGEHLTQRIQHRLSGSYRLAGQDVTVTVSVGLSTGRHPTTTRAVLAEADAALYEAKRHGRNRWASRHLHGHG